MIVRGPANRGRTLAPSLILVLPLLSVRSNKILASTQCLQQKLWDEQDRVRIPSRLVSTVARWHHIVVFYVAAMNAAQSGQKSCIVHEHDVGLTMHYPFS